MIGGRAVPRRLPIHGDGDPGARGSGAGCLVVGWGAGAYPTAWGGAGACLAAGHGAGRYLGAWRSTGGCLGLWGARARLGMRRSADGWMGSRCGAGGRADVTWRVGRRADVARRAGGHVDVTRRAGGHGGRWCGAGGGAEVRWGTGGRVGACQGGSGRLERSIAGWRYGSLRALVAAYDGGWAGPVRRPSGWIGPRAARGGSASVPGWESVRPLARVSGSRGLRSPARLRSLARVRSLVWAGVVGGGRSLAWSRAAGGGRWASLAVGLNRRWLGPLERLERPGRAPFGGSEAGRVCGVGRIVRDSREGAR
ncbi:hypothetical protein HD596_012175 [Nonomuraea jabiensis]|uniref:Uncharacterized protein n=1 Tax=Nonomuraea jabiensis TaxID=882448 RepID=A0A7W9GKA9_9ACTN|nr:hypothetical protein [Nonomuraea jabiensis]